MARNININAEGKALTDMSAGGLVGVWGAATASPVSTGSFNSFSTSPTSKSTSTDIISRCYSESNTSHRAMTSPKSSGDAAASPDHPVSHTNASAGGDSIKGQKVRRAASGAGNKRQLNPDRMERKASREKRRREEVNSTVGCS